MTQPFLQDPDLTLYVGDVREMIAELADASVDCVITSPPYWGLRDYGTGDWEGGDPGCDHLRKMGGTCKKCDAISVDDQIGLEPLHDCLGWATGARCEQCYVCTIVGVFRGVRRVLSPYGTLWLNLGDSYVSSPRGNAPGDYSTSSLTNPQRQDEVKRERVDKTHVPGLKQKDLVGIPWRVALALQADGWYLRIDVVWSKPNPLPESVTDRPTKSHEYVFLLAKSDRYFFDQEAVREPTKSLDPDEPSYRPNSARIAVEGRKETSAKHEMSARSYNPAGRNIRSVWEITTRPFPGAHFAVFPPDLAERALLAGCPAQVCRLCGKPRERIVERGEPQLQANTWSANGAAQYDTDLGEYGPAEASSTLKHVVPRTTLGWTHCECAYEGLEPGDLDLIATPLGEHDQDDPSLDVGRAGLSRPRDDDEGVRLITRYEQRMYAAQLKASPAIAELRAQAGPETFAHYTRTDRAGARPIPPETLERWIEAGLLERVTLPEPSEGSYRPGIVLDPFMGSGTTAIVARTHERHAVGIELKPDYAKMIAARSAQQSLFTEAAV